MIKNIKEQSAITLFKRANILIEDANSAKPAEDKHLTQLADIVKELNSREELNTLEHVLNDLRTGEVNQQDNYRGMDILKDFIDNLDNSRQLYTLATSLLNACIGDNSDDFFKAYKNFEKHYNFLIKP